MEQNHLLEVLKNIPDPKQGALVAQRWVGQQCQRHAHKIGWDIYKGVYGDGSINFTKNAPNQGIVPAKTVVAKDAGISEEGLRLGIQIAKEILEGASAAKTKAKFLAVATQTTSSHETQDEKITCIGKNADNNSCLRPPAKGFKTCAQHRSQEDG